MATDDIIRGRDEPADPDPADTEPSATEIAEYVNARVWPPDVVYETDVQRVLDARVALLDVPPGPAAATEARTTPGPQVMRVLVCGSRTYGLDHMLPAIIGSYADATQVTVIHGAAKGADRHAGDYANCRGLDVEEYPADWDKHGKAAGPIRNQQMLDEGKPDLVLAFVDKPLADSRGTAHMVRIARKAGVPTYVIEKAS